MRADLGRLINFIERDGVEAERGARLCAPAEGRVRRATPSVIDAPREDRERVCLGVAERAGVCALEPAPGGRLQVTFTDAPDVGRVAAVCRVARDRGWRAYRAVEAFVSASDACRRRALLDHFGDTRAGAPAGGAATCATPTTIGLPDPASLTRAGTRAGRRRRRPRARSTRRCWTR